MAAETPERVTDDIATEADQIESRARRLMARRAALGPDTWQTRQQRANLLAEIDDELGEWNEWRAT